MADTNTDWWKHAAEWSKQNPGQPLDYRQIQAAGPPPEEYKYLMQGQEWQPYQAAGVGEWRPNYYMEDLNAAAYQDWEIINALNQQKYGQQLGSLEDYARMMQDLHGRGEQQAGAAYETGARRWNTAMGRTAREAEQTYTHGQQYYSTALTNIQDSLRDLTTGALGFSDEVWAKGQQALGEFRTQMDNMMTSWMSGHQEQTAQAKQTRASELAAQGYSPDEIQAEMRKMDLSSVQEQGRQAAEFSIAEEMNYRQLQQNYTTLGAQTETAMRQMIGQATQTEWGQESTIANMRAQLGQWRTSIIGTARLGAEEAMTNLLLNRTQYQIANNLMVANGYGQYANMMQGLDASYLPWSDMIATLLGAEMNLQSWQFGWQGGNIMTNYAGVDVLTSATSQAQAGLSAM